MKRIDKIIAYIMIILVIFQSVFFSRTFADDTENVCPACTVTPNSMQMYINFQVELMGILQNNSANLQHKKFKRNKGLFSYKVFSLSTNFVNSLVGKIKKETTTELQALRSLNIASVLLYKISVGESSLLPILILLKGEPIVRDHKKLQELDFAMNDLIWDLGINGLRKKPLTDQAKSDIISLQKKYSFGGTYPIFSELKISGNVKYKELLTAMLKWNNLMKKILYKGYLSDMKALQKEYSKGNIVFKFNDNFVDLLREEYRCASWEAVCKHDFSAVKNDFSKMGGFRDSISNSMKIIRQANQNLKRAFAGIKTDIQTDSETWNLTPQQMEMLRIVYGLDASKMSKSQINLFKRLFDNMKKGVANISLEIANEIDAIKKENLVTQLIQSNKTAQNSNYLSSISVQEKKTFEDMLVLQKYSLNNKAVGLISDMQAATDQIMMEKFEDKKILLLSINQNTHYFVEIGGYIHYIVENIIGKKGDDNLVDNLGDICEYQCSNKGGICY